MRLAPREFVKHALPAFLSGRELWCQGFSEPEAGSDLGEPAHARERGAGWYVIRGPQDLDQLGALRNLVSRTRAHRHVRVAPRGVTAFIVDVRQPGIHVNAIEQANGTDELAEVVFDDVFVAEDRIVGAIDGGWDVAMHILSCERGTFAWFRHGFLYQQLLNHLPHAESHSDRAVGEALLDLAAVSASGYQGVLCTRPRRRSDRAPRSRSSCSARRSGRCTTAARRRRGSRGRRAGRRDGALAPGISLLANRDRLRRVSADAARDDRQAAAATAMSGSDAEQAFLASAREAFRRDPGSASLDALGAWDLLDELADDEARAALYAVFRATDASSVARRRSAA
jgi:alkylation response protein AidB-like acyl-CoA dehydrogenase